MNSLRLFWREQRAIAILALVIGTIVLAGLILAASVFIATYVTEDFGARSFCMSNDCTKEFISAIDQSLAIAKSTLDFAVALVTIGGIFVALQTYFNTAANAALTNHIEHLKVFGEYLKEEIEKRDRLSQEKIDTLLLYALIFNQSRRGKTTVSDEYTKLIDDLNTIISESNERCVVGTPGGFSYNDHQRKVRDHLKRGGITVIMAPRNDYFEMEGQLFSLIQRISQSFCPPNSVRDLVKPTYY